MSLLPDQSERVAQARADLRLGVPIIVKSTTGIALVAAAETLSSERLSALRDLGTSVLAITDWRARTLKAHVYDGDLTRLILPDSADTAWVRAVSDPATDLATPMKGPFAAARDGSAEIHRLALRLVKEARLLPAALVTDVAEAPKGLTCIDLETVHAQAGALHDVVAGRVPLHVSENARVHVFRPEDGGEEHYAVEIGRPDRNAPVLARLHSACFTGDVLGSLKCDCGPQLNAALELVSEHGAGVVLYLNQEGRGIGLANKMRAYSLQDQGYDTVEANHRLGFEDDERDFRLGAMILERMGITHIRLMTNNPAKVAMMERSGVTVTERVPLKVGRNPLNEKYLDVKAKKSGHIL